MFVPLQLETAQNMNAPDDKVKGNKQKYIYKFKIHYNAYYFTIGKKRQKGACRQEQVSCSGLMSSASWRLRSCLHYDS